jgi:phosphoadenosine phosphosulfate reductase
MLLDSPRHTARDIEKWALWEREDALTAKRIGPKLAVMADRAAETVRDFAAAGPCYVGCSWGKDSTVLVHVIASHGIALPVVWIRVDGVENPDCPLVRDAFLSAHRIEYHEIRAQPGKRLTSGDGFAKAARLFGGRHVSGVRSDESRTRRIRVARWGTTTANTCAPLARWTAPQVFAYLHLHGQPVHPAYAQSMGGAWHRDRIRVGALGGERGRGHGREEWERRYYPLDMAAIRAPE